MFARRTIEINAHISWEPCIGRVMVTPYVQCLNFLLGCLDHELLRDVAFDHVFLLINFGFNALNLRGDLGAKRFWHARQRRPTALVPVISPL
jgi:hypothetical protein